MEAEQEGYEKEFKIKVPPWPYTTADLALMYRVKERAMEGELNRISKHLQGKHGHLWWVPDVLIIFEKLTWPYVSEEIWKYLKSHRR